MQQMVNCASCGSQYPAGQRFCTACGVKFPEIVSPPAWQPPQTQQQVVSQQEQPWETPPAPAAPAAPAVRKIAAASRKYILLNAAAIIFKIIGWVVLIGGILGSMAVGLLASQGAMAGLVSLMDKGMALVGVSGVAGAGLAVIVLVGIVGSLLLGLGMLAFAELSSAVMAIDENVKAQG